MNKYIDNMDKSLYEYINSITFDGFTKEEIHNIAMRAKRKQRRNMYQIVAVFSFLVLISITSVSLYKNYTNHNNMNIYSKIGNTLNNKININVDEKPNAELYIEEIKINDEKEKKYDLVIYKAKTDENDIYSAGCFAKNPNNVYVAMQDVPKIYVIKVEKIIESSFAVYVPTTKFRASIIENIKGTDSGSIEIFSNGGIVSIYDIEKNGIDASLDSKYTSLSSNDKMSTFVRLVSDFDYNHIEEPIVGKVYIVSLDENNKVISNCDYPLLEFNTKDYLYKTKSNEWKKFNY